MNKPNFKSSVTNEYDALVCRYKVLSNGSESEFLEFLESLESYISRHKGAEQELARLQTELVKTTSENKNLHQKLKNAQQLIEVERVNRITVEREKLELDIQISKVVDMLGQGNINETRERLQFISANLSGIGCTVDGGRTSLREPLSTINEDGDTIGSIRDVSDIDLTEGEELDGSKTRSGRSFRSLSPDDNRSGEKRKSSPNKHRSSGGWKVAKNNNEDKENIRNLEKNKNHTQLEFIPSAPVLSSDEHEEFIPEAHTPFRGSSLKYNQELPFTPQVQVFTPKGGTLYMSPGNSPHQHNHLTGSAATGRQHSFATKTIYWTDFCQPCFKRIRFGKTALKCRDCRATCHAECKDAVPLPCVPSANNHSAKGHYGTIVDYAPKVAPMVPALVVHCTNEVEARGLTEVGIYRVSGSDREVKELRDRFLKGKGPPNLSGIDIHVVCCTLKVFLRSLHESLIPAGLWRDFISAAEKTEKQDALAVLYQAISDLPRPNRDTLAWIIVHLQKVAECVECKMPMSNLAKVFGPTLIGYSHADLQPMEVMNETRMQQKVMELLLDISGDYWRTFVVINEEQLPPKATGVMATPDKCNSLKNTRRRSLLSFAPITPIDFSTPRKNSKK